MTTNYNNGKIYMIEPICEYEVGDIYIGSTTKQYLSQRFTFHRRDYLNYKSNDDAKPRQYMTSFSLFDKYGIENCKITLLEDVCCSSKNELLAREAHYIRTMKCVNKVIPTRSRKEYEADNRDIILQKKKDYNHQNRDIILQKKKEYRESNKDKIKDYYEQNKDKISEYQKEYSKDYNQKNREHQNELARERYQLNKEKINKDKVCSCGCIIRNINQHLKTKKHFDFILKYGEMINANPID
jgi:hypothetical protein